MTDVQTTITTAGRASSERRSDLHSGAGASSPLVIKPIGPAALSPRQAEVLEALRSTGTQARAAEFLGTTTNTIHDVVKILRRKGAIGPGEYGKPPARGRAPKARSVRYEMGPGSPVALARAAALARRPHVIEAIRFARRLASGKRQKVSTLTCSCNARLRASDSPPAASHEALASLWLEHKNGRPIAHGRGPREEHGRLIGEELPMV
jgi:DNA-binding CsgD family transcriptional regulator